MKIVKKKNLIFEYKKNIYVVVCGSYRGKDIYGEKKTNVIIPFCSTHRFKDVFEISLLSRSGVFLKFYYMKISINSLLYNPNLTYSASLLPCFRRCKHLSINDFFSF